MRCWWTELRRDIAEQLPAVVDLTVLISIKYQPCIVRTGAGPRDFRASGLSEEIEYDSISRISHRKAVTVQVNENGIEKTKAAITI